MAKLFVKPGHIVKHDGVLYGAHEDAEGYALPDMPKEQAKALLDANVVQTTDPAVSGESKIDTSAPTDEEIAAAAEAAGQPAAEGKKGLFR